MDPFVRSALALMGGSSLVLAVAGSAFAAPTNYVTNGSFETNGGIGQIAPNSGPNIALPGWTKTVLKDPGSQGFAFVIDNTADTAGFPSVFSAPYAAGPTIKVWGPPNNPFPVGGTAGVGPDGAFWVGIGGDYGRSSIKQTISGLTAGQEYELSFVWAGGQFTDEQGATNQYWDYKLDGSNYQTNVVSVPGKGFEGWFNVTKKFTASGSPFDLEFSAFGSAVSGMGSLPPFLMLDNVKILESTPTPPTSVPGPLPVLGAGMALGWTRRLRRRLQAAQSSAQA